MLGEFLLFSTKVLLFLAVLLILIGVVLLFTKDRSQVAGYKSVLKLCLGAVCVILCILLLIQLFWGSGWRIAHILLFVISALIAILCFSRVRNQVNKSK